MMWLYIWCNYNSQNNRHRKQNVDCQELGVRENMKIFLMTIVSVLDAEKVLETGHTTGTP
jgi:hypothetical protein